MTYYEHFRTKTCRAIPKQQFEITSYPQIFSSYHEPMYLRLSASLDMSKDVVERSCPRFWLSSFKKLLMFLFRSPRQSHRRQQQGWYPQLMWWLWWKWKAIVIVAHQGKAKPQPKCMCEKRWEHILWESHMSEPKYGMVKSIVQVVLTPANISHLFGDCHNKFASTGRSI